MSIPKASPNVPGMELLGDCGGVPDDRRPWPEEPALKHNFKNLELSAGMVMVGYSRAAVSFYG